jgi:hypothetical protein
MDAFGFHLGMRHQGRLNFQDGGDFFGLDKFSLTMYGKMPYT